MAKAVDFGATGLWVRVNALNSPWLLDDSPRIVGEVGDRLDVVMVAEDRGRRGTSTSSISIWRCSRPRASDRPSRSSCTRSWRRAGRQQCRVDRRRLAAHAGHEPRAGRSRRLAGDEDDAGRRRPSRLSRARRPQRRRARERAAGPLALHDRAHGRRLRGAWAEGVLRAVRRFLRRRGLRGAIPQRLPARLRRRLEPASEPDRHRQAGVLARSGRGRVRPQDPRPPCRTAPAPS